jgi:23S rRNA (guanosine2251-2'-O)-methyltransferase
MKISKKTAEFIPTAKGFSTRRQGASRRSVYQIHEDGERRKQQSRKFIREGYIWIYGLHAVEAALTTRGDEVVSLYLSIERSASQLQPILELARQYAIVIRTVERKDLDQIVNNNHHQGVAIQIQKRTIVSLEDIKNLVKKASSPPFLILLDCIQDPHNLGACIRTAEVAGATAVIYPKDRSATITPIVRKVAAGAVEYISCIPVTNLARTMRQLKEWGIWLVGADGQAEQNVFDANLVGPIGIVLGNEGTGLRQLTRKHCDIICRIPQFGHTSSLNISVAAGIFIFEVIRQRLAHSG